MQRPTESVLRKMLESSPLRQQPVEDPQFQPSQHHSSTPPSFASLVSRESCDKLRPKATAAGQYQLRWAPAVHAAHQTPWRLMLHETDSPLLCALLGPEPAEVSTRPPASTPCGDSDTSGGGPPNHPRVAARAMSVDQISRSCLAASASSRHRYLHQRLLASCDREKTERLLRLFLACVDFTCDEQTENRANGFGQSYVVVRAKLVMRRLIDFTEHLHGFATIPLQCRTAFVHAAAAGCILLHCCYIYDTTTGSLKLERGMSLFISDLSRVFPTVSSALWTECAQLSHSLKQLLNGHEAVTHGERAKETYVFALLQAIIITSPELALSCDVSDHALSTVADAQLFYMVLLRRQCEATYSYEYAADLQPVLLMYVGIIKRLSSLMLEAMIQSDEIVEN